jgi:hypothetical protein
MSGQPYRIGRLKDDTCSSGMAPEENANVTRLEPTTRARLNVVRRPSTPN